MTTVRDYCAWRAAKMTDAVAGYTEDARRVHDRWRACGSAMGSRLGMYCGMGMYQYVLMAGGVVDRAAVWSNPSSLRLTDKKKKVLPPFRRLLNGRASLGHIVTTVLLTIGIHICVPWHIFLAAHFVQSGCVSPTTAYFLTPA